MRCYCYVESKTSPNFNARLVSSTRQWGCLTCVWRWGWGRPSCSAEPCPRCCQRKARSGCCTERVRSRIHSCGRCWVWSVRYSRKWAEGPVGTGARGCMKVYGCNRRIRCWWDGNSKKEEEKKEGCVKKKTTQDTEDTRQHFLRFKILVIIEKLVTLEELAQEGKR